MKAPGQVRREFTGLIREIIQEELQTAGPAYMKKEQLRELIQGEISRRVSSGSIASEAQLKDFFATLEMVAKTLGMIPLDVWFKLAGNAEPVLRKSKSVNRRNA